MEIDGRAIAAAITAGVKASAAELTAAGTTPTLGILSATEHESTAYYVRSLMRAAARVGITTELVSLPGTATTEEFAAACERLALAPNCHGIIAQTPFPPGIDQRR